MKEKRLNVIIIVIHDESGLAGEKYERLESDILELKPDFLDFVGAHSFHIAFRNNIKNSYKTEMFLRRLEELSRVDPRFAGLRIGREAGPCLCTVGAFGRLQAIPIGFVACQAMKAAVS
jgi:hypothetical protein